MKKVLIITYYWPPAGGPGVQRWLKFVKYLRNFNIEPVIYIPENPSYPIIDESLIEEIPSDLTIIKHPIDEPYKIANVLSKGDSRAISKGIIPSDKKQNIIQKMMLYIRGNFYIPDARKKWVKPSVIFLTDYIPDHDIDTVITTGPPHSLHLIGLQLKSNLGLQWIADFRDPWTKIGYHKKLRLNVASRKKHKILEKKVLQSADKIIVTSFLTKDQFESITERPISVITNGYDDQPDIEAINLDRRFSISHIGSLSNERNPKLLWQVLYELSRENNTFKSLLQINLVGTVGEEILRVLEEYDLTQFLNLKGYIEHKEALKYQRKSQLLLLVEIDSEDTRCIIPGKLFEYMISERPILAIGPEASDVERILTETNTGNYFNYSERRALKDAILEYFNAFRKNALNSHGIGLQQYHRKALTKKLSELILE